jgi:hypothetical protein
MSVRREGLEGALAPPPLAGQNKKACFSNFLKENSMFLGIFRQILCFCHTPPGKFCPPLKKSLRTPIGVGGRVGEGRHQIPEFLHKTGMCHQKCYYVCSHL